MNKIIGLIGCNHFYVSSGRVFAATFVRFRQTLPLVTSKTLSRAVRTVWNFGDLTVVD